MTEDRLNLFCLVDGEPQSNVFSVKPTPADTVDDLKKLIKTEKTNDFSDVDADKLTLWRVSIPVVPANRHKPIVLTEVDSLTELEPTDDVSDVFDEPPPKKTIHIIVQRPPPVQAPVPTRALTPLSDSLSNKSRPASPTDIRADLDKITDKFFSPASRNIKFLNEFVQGSHGLPVTEGSISGLPTVGKRGFGAQSDIPYNQAEEILKDFPGKLHLPLFGVSGCGKTRTAVDLLSRSWGLYFNAGEADYGSNDMTTLAQALSVHSDIYVSKDTKQNTERIRCLTYGLLYVRLLILEHCLNLAGGRNTFSCHRWMLLQIATPAFRDIFQELFQSISEYLHSRLLTSTTMNSVMVIIVQEQFRKVQELLYDRLSASSVHSKFLVVLDESQILGRLFPAAYLDSDMETIRSALAPVLFAFRRLADEAAQNNICVMPCGTGLSSYELTWSGGSAAGGKLSKGEYDASKLSDMVVDFAGWTDVASISSYLERLGRGLDDGARERLAMLVPPKAILRLHRKLRGRFRPIVSTIEDIIEADDPMVWKECISEREYRLTTASIPTTDGEKRRLEGNLCGELRRMFDRVRLDQGSVAFAEFRNVEATLKFAIAAFVTQGGYMAYKGQLPKLVETAFGRIKISNGDFYTTIDEPFAFEAADNYFQNIDPDYFQHRQDQSRRTPTEKTRGKEWEFSIPFEMVHLFHDKTVPAQLYHDAEPPHSMFQRKAAVVGWNGKMRTTGCQEMTMADFLDAHIYNNSERDGDPVAPFFFPEEHLSGPDIVFVVRFSGLAPDDTLTSSSTPSPGSASSEILCPVFVQLKLCAKLSQPEVVKARGTVRPGNIKGHGVDLSQYCRPHGHYISLIVSYPVELAEYFMDKPLEVHKDGLTEIVLTIDDSNIDDLLSEEHVPELKLMKRLAVEMAETTKEVKRRRANKSYSISVTPFKFFSDVRGTLDDHKEQYK
ncbi:hypothetical protein BGZ96_001754 [Linnemannia gamsii]|uniref:Crinkler effector protein N-terminal domain-containing protein n=1 Tax=Linnemannia gamsii TaxID=64522 RepID=A0ABQ7K9M4_9FUNG|nr:hypothetical protein BGZ96_001754 [Linnemannia gamsii]